MKLINKCKKAAILATVLGGICFGATADAATVLIGGATDYKTGTQIGALNGSWVTSHVDTTVISDLKQSWFDKSVYDSYGERGDDDYYMPKAEEDGVIDVIPWIGYVWQYYYIWENHPDYKNMTQEEFFTEDVMQVVGSMVDSMGDDFDGGIFVGSSPILANDCDIHRVVLNGKTYAYIRQTTGTGTVAMDGIVIDLSKWETSGSAQYKGVTDSVNSHGVAGKGKFVYCADYTGCRIGVGELSEEENRIVNRTDLTLDIQEDLKKNAGIDFSDGTYYLHGENLLVDGDYLYVLTNVNKNSQWDNYQPSYLIKYYINPNGSLEYFTHTTMGLNTDTVRIGKFNNHIFTTAIGGYQNYGNPNEKTSLDFANINEDGLFGTSGPIKIPQNVKDAHTEFRNLRILPNGTAYVLCYSISTGGYKTGMTVYKTTVSNLLADSPQNWDVIVNNEEAKGWFNGIDAEYYTKRVWVREGNDLTLYVDGKKVHTWAGKEFGTSDMFTTMQAFDVMTPEGISGKLAKLNELADKVTNDNVVWNESATVETVTGANTISGNTTITADASKVDLGNNISAAVYAKDNNVSITAGNLQLQSENSVATPVGIYAGDGKEVNIKADKLNVITKGYEDGNSLTNAIWLDPGAEGEQAKITIEAPVNIAMTGGFGGNGIAIQKTDRWGESSTEAAEKAEVIIKGDVSVKGADNQTWGIGVNSENVFSRFNNAGILTAVDNSSVTVDGNVYMDVYGNGIATTAQGSTVTVKGGEITVPTGMNYGYYTLASYLGTINMNTGADGNTPGAETVKLNGDIFALKDTSNINLALTTAESQLNGAIDNGGNVKLYLQNGATWNNVANNTRYYLDSEDTGSLFGSGRTSHINNFVGSSSIYNTGVIYQGLNSENIKIDNYSGNAVVMYERDDADKFTGGTITIGDAEEGSAIVLRTNYTDDLESNEDKINQVLGDMAGKLYYLAAINGGNTNLSGKVEIAEGLLTGAFVNYASSLTYNATNGQASHNTEEVDANEKPKEEFTGNITGGDLSSDTIYGELVVEKDGQKVIDFSAVQTKDEEGNSVDAGIIALKPVVDESSEDNSVIAAKETSNPVIIEMGGKELTVDASDSVETVAVQGIVADSSKVEIREAGKVTIKANGDASAIHASGADAIVKITTASGDKTVRLEATGATDKAVLHADNGAKVEIDGIVKIVETNGNEAVKVGKGAEVIIGGGEIGSENAEVAIRVEDNGKIAINKERKYKVVTNGDIVFGTALQPQVLRMTRMASQSAVGSENVEAESVARDAIYATKDSVHNGNLVNENISTNKDFSVEFSNGAQWNGSAQGINLNVLLSGDGTAWTGNYDETTVLDLQIEDGATWVVEDKPATKARTANTTNVATMKGEGGFVEMGTDAMNIEKYSGSTTFIYANEDGNVTGGDLTIQEVDGDKATVNLRTGSIGTTEEGKVLETLNELAGKLTYVGDQDAEKAKLSGELQIDEGLMTGTSTITFAGIKFDADGTVTNVTADDVEIRGNGTSGGSVNVQETTAVRIAKSAMGSTVMMWRNESDDVMQRMGDLRLGTEENGIWAKYYNGDASYNEAGTIYNSNYKAYQVGYDKKLDNGWTVGAALSYNDAEHKYEMGAKGEGTSIGVTAYGAWNNDKGHFANVAVKGSKLDNEYNAFNEYKSMEANGDYSTWGLSVSAEYGRRMEQSNGFYFEPSAKLTIGRVQDADYTVTADNGQVMFVEQGGFNSIVGELGVGMGKRFERGTVFTKFALAHEFAGDFASSYMDKNSNILNSDADFGGSWYEWQLGGSVKVNDNSYVYATYEKTFGGDAARDWRVDAGVRWTF